MIIAVTGSSGFVGSYLLKKLNMLGHEVIELDIRKGIDITDWEAIKDLPDFHVCIHLAAKSFVPASYVEARSFYHVNINGTLNMLELCKLRNAKLIFTSSYVYGKPDYLPVDEQHKTSAFNPYAHSKIMCEELCQNYASFFGVPVIIFRPFNIYGHGQDKIFLIPEILEKATLSDTIELLDPVPKRDMIYVEDLVDAYISAINSGLKNEIFNIGSGVSYSVAQIAEMILSNLGKKTQITYKHKKRVNEVNDVVADISRARKLLGWQPKTSIESGLSQTVRQYMERKNI